MPSGSTIREELSRGFISGVSVSGRLRGREYQLDSDRESAPFVLDIRELLAPKRRDLIELCPAAFVGGAPFRVDESLPLQSIQGRVKRTLVYLEHVSRDFANSLCDSPSVQRASANDLEYQKVQRALHHVDFVQVRPHT